MTLKYFFNHQIFFQDTYSVFQTLSTYSDFQTLSTYMEKQKYFSIYQTIPACRNWKLARQRETSGLGFAKTLL